MKRVLIILMLTTLALPAAAFLGRVDHIGAGQSPGIALGQGFGELGRLEAAVGFQPWGELDENGKAAYTVAGDLTYRADVFYGKLGTTFDWAPRLELGLEVEVYPHFSLRAGYSLAFEKTEDQLEFNQPSEGEMVVGIVARP